MQLSAAALAAIGLLVLLISSRDDALKQVSLLVYGGSLVLMFLASAAHHLIRSGPSVSLLLRKADHSSIYLLIAGTYTPICLHFFAGFWQWGLVGIVWAMAAVGGMVLGGVLFTVGAVIYVVKKPNLYPGVFGFHELWHVFVILGCLCHFVVIAAYVALNGA